VIGGSIVMALGAGVIAFSSVSQREHQKWQDAATREGERYHVDPAYTRAKGAGRDVGDRAHGRTWVDWLVVSGATLILAGFASVARPPAIALRWEWAAALTIVMLGAAAGCGVALWRTTRFS